MRDRRGRRFRARRLAALAAGGGAAAGPAIERRHLRRVARDPDYARLSVPLNGLQRTVRSVDGTRLHVRIFGPDDAPTIVLAHGWTEALGTRSPDACCSAHARRIVAMLAQPAELLGLRDTGNMSSLERPTECSDALHQLVAQCGRTDHTPDGHASGPWALPE
jgi:hypothetical protein